MRARPGSALALLAGLALAARAADTPPSPAAARLVVEPSRATVGDRLAATLDVTVSAAVEVEPVSIGPRLGSFAVDSESWTAIPSEPPEASTRRFRWTASFTAFETGSLEVPSIVVRLREGAEAREIRTAPVPIEIRSVLAEGPADEPPQIADLKSPASVPPDYGTLSVALVLLALLLAVSAVVWWLNRRFAGRLAAVPVPTDPFHREPPHVWVYRELQRLLEQRLAEQGRVDEFYAEVGRIVKTYLAGRYRVDLLERTTEEVRDLLARAGAPGDAAEHAHGILADCDLVKFARLRPAPTVSRTVVETVYALVDATRVPDTGRGAA